MHSKNTAQIRRVYDIEDRVDPKGLTVEDSLAPPEDAPDARLDSAGEDLAADATQTAEAEAAHVVLRPSLLRVSVAGGVA